MCSSVCLFATPAIWCDVKVVSCSHRSVYETGKVEGVDSPGKEALPAVLATVVCTASGKLVL